MIQQLVSGPLCYLDPGPSWTHQSTCSECRPRPHDVRSDKDLINSLSDLRCGQLWDSELLGYLALVLWSSKFGSATVGTPAASASKEGFQPLMVEEGGDRRMGEYALLVAPFHHQPLSGHLLLESCGSPVSPQSDHGFDSQRKRFPFSFKPPANYATYKL